MAGLAGFITRREGCRRAQFPAGNAIAAHV
jgi:hypothetical protein